MPATYQDRDSLPTGPHVATGADGTRIAFQFENENYLSIFFGAGSHSKCTDDGAFRKGNRIWCPDVEIYPNISKKTTKRCIPEMVGSSEEGYVTPDRLAEILHCLSKHSK